jgi:hypothetical protein
MECGEGLLTAFGLGFTTAGLLNDLCCLLQHRLRDGPPDRLGGFEIDHEIVGGGRLPASARLAGNSGDRAFLERRLAEITASRTLAP